MKVSRAWLQTYFEEELPTAQELADLFTFHSFEVEGVEEVDGDWIIDLDVLPNRSSDCLSHRGVARELATLLSRPMKREPLRSPLASVEAPSNFTVTVDDPKLCRRYMGAVVRGVCVKESPKWLQRSLERIGQRSINNIVDATNYVMFDLGQPLHAFDLAKLMRTPEGATGIGVRLARPGEQIAVLTGETYELSARDLIITDSVAEKPLAIAGIKGGARAEISTDTVDIIIEAANFDYTSVRKTSQSLRLATDASLRFQNEPAPELPAFAMRDVIKLLEEIAGGRTMGVYDAYMPLGERMPVDVTLSHINKLLGVSMTIDDVERILVRFEWEFSLDGEEFAITPPWERSDLRIPEDIIEEIGRVYGLRSIPSILPPIPSDPPKVTLSQYCGDLIRHTLTDLGYTEVLTYTLRDKGEVELLNPLASDKAFMRMDLRSGILEALEMNVANAPTLGLSDLRVFEVGTRFTARGEELALAIGVRGITTKQAKMEAALAEDIRLLSTALGVELQMKIVDGVAECSLIPALAELPTPTAYREPLPWDGSVRYAPWSPYPYVLRDIAVWVPADTPATEVLEVITAHAGDLLVRSDLFDTYTKEDKTSYAWHLVFQSPERTLNDVEVNECMDAVTAKLHTRQGWSVR